MAEKSRVGGLGEDRGAAIILDEFLGLPNEERREERLTIWRALSISSQSSKFDAMPELDAMEFLSTRNESYTPSCTGSMGSPVVKFSPTLFPSACSS
jgi:hypothetical protein